MPRISRFQQQKLASSLVGTPGIDTSTSEAFQTVAGFANQVTQLGVQELQKKRTLEDAVKVNKSIIDFENKADQMFEKHKATYAQDPANKTDLLVEELNSLATDYNGDLQTSSGRMTFANMSRNAIQRTASKERQFAEDQRTSNMLKGLVDSQNAISTEAYRRQDWGPEDFKDFMSRHDGVMAAAAGVLGTDEFIKLDIDGKKSIATAMLEGKSRMNAVEAKAYLDGGMFDEIFDGNELSQLQDRVIRNAEQSDRLATKALNEIQDKHKFDLYDQYLKGGELSVEQIKEDVRINMLSASDGIEMLRLASTPPPTYNNNHVLNELNVALAKGELTVEDVFQNANGLTTAKQQEYIDLLTSDLQKNPAIKRAVEIWDAQIEKDALGVRSLIDAQEFNDGVEEIFNRSLEGKENPFEIVESMKARLLEKRQREDALASTRKQLRQKYGKGKKMTVEKVQKARNELLTQYRSGLITDEEAEMQAQVFEEFLSEAE